MKTKILTDADRINNVANYFQKTDPIGQAGAIVRLRRIAKRLKAKK